MQEFFWKHDFPIKLFLIVGFLSLSGYMYYIARNPPLDISNIEEKGTAYIDTCGEECKNVVQEVVSNAVATLSAKTTTINVVEKQEQNQIVTYIPMSTTFSTRSTSWVDVNGSEVNINLAEYPKNPYIDWDASVKVEHGSGRGVVRLFDITHGIGVNGSELETNSSVFVQLSSGRLNFWSGRNLYIVQIKSIGGAQVSVTSGRVKIVSK